MLTGDELKAALEEARVKAAAIAAEKRRKDEAEREKKGDASFAGRVSGMGYFPSLADTVGPAGSAVSDAGSAGAGAWGGAGGASGASPKLTPSVYCG